MQSGLYIVGTPIGNLGDMSPRAVDVLRSVDLVAAEDTRVFGKLATHFDIKTPRVSCHEHNERDVVPGLIEKLQNGMSIAVVSDAGMPGISDPGFRIVHAARAENIPVYVVPGPLGFQLTGLLFAVFSMKKNCVMIIKFAILLFITKAQIALWQPSLQWRALCQKDKLQLFVKLPKYMNRQLSDIPQI